MDLMANSTTTPPTSHQPAADVAQDLYQIAEDLHATLADRESPQGFVACSTKMREIAKQLVDALSSAAEEPPADEQTLLHDLRNGLQQFSGYLLRLGKLDTEQGFGNLQQKLKEVQKVYELLRDQLTRSQRPSVTPNPSIASTDRASAPQLGNGVEGKRTNAREANREEGGRILIVDDDWESCNSFEEAIEARGHIAVSCRRPERAIAALRDGTFEICLVDLNMPTMSGWDLLEQIKSDPMTKHVSVIVVSGSAESEGTARAIRLGADDFIAKPVDFGLLDARIMNCLARSRQHLRELTRFLPSAVVESIRKHPHRLQLGQEATVTVMFCDVRRFSKFSEHMSPSETIKWISDVMGALSQTILDEGGTLVDFVGDEVMSMWGAPQSRGDHAEAACRCALKLQGVVKELSRRWIHLLNDDMEIGIGIHSGIVSVGNTGSPQRFKYGPLGNTVNLGSRVQGASKYLRSKILITRETHRQIPRDIATRRLCSVRVNNIERPVDLFELTTESNNTTKKRDKAYEQALAEFEAERFTEAITTLSRLLTKHPEDGPSLLLMKRLIDASLAGDALFDPVWTMPGK